MTNDQTYQQIQDVLKANHFLTARHTFTSAKSKKIIGVEVDCVPIMREYTIARVLKVLSDFQVSAEWVNNADYIFVKLKK